MFTNKLGCSYPKIKIYPFIETLQSNSAVIVFDLQIKRSGEDYEMDARPDQCDQIGLPLKGLGSQIV